MSERKLKTAIARFLTLAFFSTFLWLTDVYAQDHKRPNIIFILADDLGWSSLSCSMDAKDPRGRSDYHETPNLCRLAAQGMRFSRAYAAAAICSPSRRSILYGQTPARLGDESFANRYHPAVAAYRTIPQLLKNAGYHTAHFGKWDMRAGFSPEDVGYDESDGDTGNRHGDLMTDKDDKWKAHFITNDPKRMFTLTSRAKNFMQRQTRSGNPFYLQISHYATHVDVQSRDDSYAKYLSKSPGQKDQQAAFAAMLDDLDRAVGEIITAVGQLGISETTYIFFMSDNGATEFFPPVKNRLDHPDKFSALMRNFPLRGGKWTLYEGGIRVPLIVAGPGIAANSQSMVPVAGWDLLPTFTALAGDDASPAGTSDGGSFAAILANKGEGPMARATPGLIFHRYHNGYPHSSLIDGDHKVICFWRTGEVELYDLATDPGELHNLAGTQSARADDMARRLISYVQSVNPGLIASYKK